ncbi:MAG: hypothetical protein O7C75_18765 [Verrucomicrobia bacterium]|nr:hypothetical protein [Verrucomicrobiota bacterium]
MKTCGFQTFPTVSDPVAETTGNNKFKTAEGTDGWQDWFPRQTRWGADMVPEY